MSVAMNPLRAAEAQRSEPLQSYLVGQDGEGHWVAVEAKGLAGGIFRSRQDAIHFACVETGCRPNDVIVAADPIRFRM